jgi:2-dehydropantoate 2-reductase
MKILIMGAGAVGSYYGAKLALAGHQVTFIGRGAHFAAMRDRGLELRSGERTTLVAPISAATSPAEASSPFDLILLSVKGYDAEAAIEALRPAVRPGVAVLTLLNGVDAPEQLAQAFGGEQVLAGTTTVNAAIVEPGVVLDRGVPTRTTLAEYSGALSPRLTAIGQAMDAASNEVVLSQDPAVTVWQKFVLLAPHGTITAATGLPIGQIRSLDEGMALYRQLVHETVAVARACAVSLPAEIAGTTLNFIQHTMPPTAISSMALDFERRRRVELEQITGAIIRRSQATGVPVPGFAPLYATLKARAAAFASH